MLPLALAAHAAPPACTREADFADWPGGRTLRLELDGLEPGEPVTLTVTGAVPGERVELWVGSECGLDCPPERDGACFQPSGGERVAERFADPLGTAGATVTLDPVWAGGWVVVQATAPDRASPAISQAIVVENGEAGTLGEYGQWKELSPLVVLGLSAADREYWWWPVAAGRRIQLVNRDEPDDTDCGMVLDGETTVLDCWNPGAADVWNAAPVSWWFTSYDGWVVTTQYSLDIRTVPLDTPVDWFADLDGDGYGDPTSIAVSSPVPVASASPDPRDCDDADPDARPNGLETCGDGLDQDCDGADRACRESPGATTAPAVGTRIGGTRFSSFGSTLTTGDLDGDGTPELVGTSETWQVTGYTLHRRDVDEPTFGPHEAASATSGDFTGDGQDDLALAWDHALQILPGPLGADDPTPSASLIGLDYDIKAAAGDLTGDGFADLLVASFNGPRGEMLIWNAPFSLDDAPDGTIPAVDGDSTRPTVRVSDADADGLADVWTHEVCLHLSPLPPAGSVTTAATTTWRSAAWSPTTSTATATGTWSSATRSACGSSPARSPAIAGSTTPRRSR
jgi:hypothetical protein